MEIENQILHKATTSYLPAEVWENIFQYLPTDNLANVRQTCHFFKNIVRNCWILRDRIHLHFPKHVVLNKSYTPHPAPPASTAFFMHSRITDTGSWWSPIGVMITELVLVACEFPLDLLRLTPKLKTLTARDVKLCTNPLEVAFELRALDKLAVEVGREGDPAVLDVLGQIATRLKVLDCIGTYKQPSHLQGLMKLVDSAQDTLDELVFHPDSSVIDALLQLQRLKLKRVTFKAEYFGQKNFLDEPELVEFVRAHPTIEELKMDNKPVCNQVLSQIGHVLPKLARFELQVLFSNEQNVMPLMTMAHLQAFKVANLLGKWLQFDNSCSGNFPCLKELHLTGVQVKGDGLERFLQCSTSLKYLSIKQSRFERWSQLAALTLLLKSLDKLELDNIVFTINDQYPFKSVSNLRCLKMKGIWGIPSINMKNLFAQFPHLEEVTFDNVDSVKDEVVEVMCKTLTHLRRFVLRGWETTHQSAQHVAQYCKNLKNLEVFNDWELTKDETEYFRRTIYVFKYRGEIV